MGTTRSSLWHNGTPYQVTAPHLCAGIIVDEKGKCIKAAPILRWMLGKNVVYLAAKCRSKGWKFERGSRPNADSRVA